MKQETINNQLTLLIEKLMSSIQTFISDKEPLNKIFNPIMYLDTDEDTVDPDKGSKSSISTAKDEDINNAEGVKKLTVDYF
jgi:hypothetical protein